MNPLVQEMLNTVAGQDTELVFLEGLLNDDCKCESRTHNHGRVTCSGDVSALLSSCIPPLKVCSAMHEHVTRAMNWESPCASCGRKTKDCWTIRPI